MNMATHLDGAPVDKKRISVEDSYLEAAKIMGSTIDIAGFWPCNKQSLKTA